MLGPEGKQSEEKETLTGIVLTDAQQRELKKTLKCGIYKELHKKAVLSDAQLDDLLNIIEGDISEGQ